MRLSSLLLWLPASVAGLTCYCKDSVYGLHDGCPNSKPCYHAASGVQQCCKAGDLCGDDGFCKFSHGGIPRGSGYYRSGCTDPAFADAACPQQCTKHRTLDVVFNQTTGLWACCYNGSDTLDCGNPGSDTFQARPPDQLNFRALSASAPAPSSGTATSSAASDASSSPATGATPSAPTDAAASGAETSSPPSELSTGAKAGIGVGVGIAGLALLAALAFWLIRRRKLRSERDEADTRLGVYRNGETAAYSKATDTGGRGRQAQGAG